MNINFRWMILKIMERPWKRMCFGCNELDHQKEHCPFLWRNNNTCKITIYFNLSVHAWCNFQYLILLLTTWWNRKFLSKFGPSQSSLREWALLTRLALSMRWRRLELYPKRWRINSSILSQIRTTRWRKPQKWWIWAIVLLRRSMASLESRTCRDIPIKSKDP